MSQWKQPKCPATEGWIKKVWYIYTMEYYSAIKRNKRVPLAEMWMELRLSYRGKYEREKRKRKTNIKYHSCGI